MEKEAPPPPPPRFHVHSFCKTLTASDTSTHGGFSVLRRHADECLPPLVGIPFSRFCTEIFLIKTDWDSLCFSVGRICLSNHLPRS